MQALVLQLVHPQFYIFGVPALTPWYQHFSQKFRSFLLNFNHVGCLGMKMKFFASCTCVSGTILCMLIALYPCGSVICMRCGSPNAMCATLHHAAAIQHLSRRSACMMPLHMACTYSAYMASIVPTLSCVCYIQRSGWLLGNASSSCISCPFSYF